MDVIAHLLALISIDRVWTPFHRAQHQVGEETVQLGAAMRRACRAAAPENARTYTEIAAILLHQNVGCHLAGAKEAVLRVVDAHRLVDAARCEEWSDWISQRSASSTSGRVFGRSP